MDIIYIVIMVFTLGVFSRVAGTVDPIIKQSEETYYTKGEGIIEFANIIDELEIGKETIIEDEIEGIKVLKTSKGEGKLKPKKEGKAYILPLVDYKNKYYNIIVEENKIKINELNKIGKFDKTYKDYSEDKRKENTMYIDL